MSRTAILTTGALALGLLAGCGHGVTQYAPQLRAQGELTLRYDDGFSMVAEGKEIAAGNGWGGLTDYVKCVPKAREHAESAEAAGTGSAVLSWLGGGIGVASLGGLAGAAVYDKNNELGLGILGVGVAAAVTGVVLAAIGRNEKSVANGHAVDAMNYYNDSVGSFGGTCRKPAPKPPEVEVAPTAKPEKVEKPETEERPAEPSKPAKRNDEKPAQRPLSPDEI